MNPAPQTKIFGLSVGVNPKILVVGLVALAAILFWYNSRGDEETNAPAASVRPTAATPPTTVPRARAANRRPVSRANDRGTLRVEAIDATHGDIDPTLRLDLLQRLQSVAPIGNSRNLFEMGAAPLAAQAPQPIAGPKIIPQPLPAPGMTPGAITASDVNIPLKYYGFAKPVEAGETNRGFFLDGDNILVASDGDVLKQRYLVVELTQKNARLEDIQVKKGQTLPLVPEARSD